LSCYMLKNLIPRNFLSFQIRTMKVIPIPANQDNYQYLIIDDNGKKQAAIVDPVDVSEIKKVVEKENVQLIAGFVTHHHMDHSAHAGRLRSTFGDTTEVFGHDSKRINGQTLDTVHEGTFSLGDLKVTTYHTPCHTSTHVCYFVVDQKSNERAVFTGDTLFIGGCGRFFEGNAQEMDEALNKTLAGLPDDTVRLHNLCLDFSFIFFLLRKFTVVMNTLFKISSLQRKLILTILQLKKNSNGLKNYVNQNNIQFLRQLEMKKNIIHLCEFVKTLLKLQLVKLILLMLCKLFGI
jgi:glyoxylase-like metal-dependent hydrolase (beta-lactamase superfamily II)